MPENVEPEPRVTKANPPEKPASRALSRQNLVGRLLTGPVLGLLIVLVLFVLLIGVKGGSDDLQRFASVRNLQVMVMEGSYPAVVALGMLLIIISGGIDLSVGSVVGLVTVVTMFVYRLRFAQTGSTVDASWAAIPAGIAVGGLCGLVNGLIVTQLRIAPFVATLGMLGIARGLAYWLSERRPLSFPLDSRPDWVNALATVHPEAGLFNPGFWSLVVLALAVALMLRYTILGRYCYAIGSNQAAARLCGVSIQRTKILLYMVSGLLTGWAGVMLFARSGTGDPTAGKELELRVIAAVVIGGASLNGGQGTVGGTLIGMLILETLANGVSNFEVPIEMQLILIGLIIIANTALSQWRKK